MDELNKMRRVIDRDFPEADVRCILVLDATTGQNGLAQAKAFKEVCEVGGIILTKLDGTAKGGIALAIRQELAVPVWYIGVGEGIDDLQPFDAREFINAGSITINGDKITDETKIISKDMAIEKKAIVVRRGKKKYYIGKFM